MLGRPAPRAYDLVLLDPPYELPDPEVAGWLAAAAAHGWFTEDVVVVVERSARGPAFPWPPPLRAVRERRYGETVLHIADASPRRSGRRSMSGRASAVRERRSSSTAAGHDGRGDRGGTVSVRP